MRGLGVNTADFVILGLIGGSALLSLIRGLVKEILSLVSWVASFWLAFAYFHPFAALLARAIPQEAARIAIAFILILLGSLIGFGLLNMLISRLLRGAGLGDTDRLLGMLFGALRGLAIVLVLILLAGLTPLPAEPWWRESLLLPQLAALAHWLVSVLLPEFAGHFGYDAAPGVR